MSNAGLAKLAQALLLLIIGCAAQARPQTEVASPRVPVRLVEVRSGLAPRRLAGTVSASSHALVSTRITAAVSRVLVHEGDRVARGAVLVRLADTDVRAQLAAARVVLETTEAAERRAVVLARGGHLPASALDAAQAQRAQAQGQVSALRETLAYTEVRAPFDGTVLARLVSAGDLVGPGQPMVELSGELLEIVALASEEEARSVAPGQTLSFEVGGVRGEASVSAVSPGGDPVTHRSVVRARIAAGSAARPGDFARLQLPPDPAARSLRLPRSAVVERGDLTGVFLVREGRAELRWIAAGEVATDAISVRAGLRAGDSVVDSPGDLRDGDPIEVADGR
jgi:membrane fusion protein, multidrug efflux system